MTRKIKGLGLAFVAVAAMSMVAAGGAQASELHANFNGNVSVFGNQTAQQHVFTTKAGTVKCEQAFFEATVTKVSGTQVTAQDVTATPRYTGCQAFGTSANIDVNGCKYTLTGASQPALTALVDVTGCTSGKGIEITTAICRMTVPAQNSISHLVFANTTAQDVDVSITASAITYQADGPLCPNMATGQTLNDGTYVGQATFQAREDKGSGAATTHNGHEYTPLLQTGALVALQGT